MKFTPKTEEEIQESSLWQPGVYDFEIIDADEARSKSGNDMIKLHLNVFDANGDSRIMYDYLLEAMPHKLRHAADACSLLDHYEMGNLEAHQFVAKTGKLKISISKDKTGQYPDRNQISDYVKREPIQSSGKGDLNDEIPF